MKLLELGSTLNIDMSTVNQETPEEEAEKCISDLKNQMEKFLSSLEFYAGVNGKLPLNYEIWVDFYHMYFLNRSVFLSNYATRFELSRLEFDRNGFLVNHSFSHEKMLMGGLGILRTACGIILFHPEHFLRKSDLTPKDYG